MGAEEKQMCLTWSEAVGRVFPLSLIVKITIESTSFFNNYYKDIRIRLQ